MSGAVIIAVAVAAIAIILVRNNQAQDAINAIAVGDCVDSTQYEPELGTIPATPTVSCDDPKATHKVIGIVDGQSAAVTRRRRGVHAVAADDRDHLAG